MKRNQHGFTLVELAIVMVIIGLLIGGILKGQQILENSRITATVTQVGTIDAAAKAFYDTYSAYPGDLMNAQDRVPNCASCIVTPDPTPPTSTPCSSGDGAGNGVIGSCTWNMVNFQSTNTVTTTPARETILFWAELAHAGLLYGTTDDGLNGAGVADFGGSLPEAKVNGGFVVGHASANQNITFHGGSAYNMQDGPVLMLLAKPGTPSGASGGGPLSPSVASVMDRKLDDGLPGTGSVQAYGPTSTCYNGGSTYKENDTKHKDCGLYFRILKP